MFSALNWIRIVSVMTVLMQYVNLASIPDTNSLGSSEYDFKSDYPEISLKIGKDVSSSSEDYEATPLCKSVKKQINPNALARSRGYDVEDMLRFSHSIEVDVCENVGKPCSLQLPFKKSMCRQNYMKIQLKVISKDRKSSFEDFDIPSVCECVFFHSKSNSIGSLKNLT